MFRLDKTIMITCTLTEENEDIHAWNSAKDSGRDYFLLEEAAYLASSPHTIA